jgi:phage shock protein PspC (stress-responsive transcriptional regulator)
MNCKTAMASLLASIESGAAMNDDAREHLRTCARCSELLDSAMQFQSTLTEDVEVPEVVDVNATAEKVEEELGRTTIRTRVRIGGIIGLILIPITSYITTHSDAGIYWRAISAELIFIVGLLAIVPLIIVRTLVARMRTPTGQRLYKRFGNGRHQISGVCAGISEATGINVISLRLAFVVLIFFRGLGLLIYLAFDLAMQIHPDDREHLRRFRIRRALSSMLARVRMQ